jgi:hypothetical protein
MIFGAAVVNGALRAKTPVLTGLWPGHPGSAVLDNGARDEVIDRHQFGHA